MSQLKSILTDDERAERNELEAVITTGIQSFVEVGTALLTIAEKRLYRETHGSFEPYCQEKWSMSARQAYRLCEAVTVIKSLPESATKLVTTESQARELAKVDVASRFEVLAAAGDKPTAKKIRQAAKTISATASMKDGRTAPCDIKQATPDAVDAESNGVGSISGGEMLHDVAAAGSDCFLPRATAGTNLSEAALELLERAKITRDDMDAITDCVNGNCCDLDALGAVLESLVLVKRALVAYQMEIKRK